MAWLDDPGNRDSFSYVLVSMFAAAAAAAANLLRQWPTERTWVRQFGSWLSAMTAGMLVLAVGWEPLMPLHRWPLGALVISAAWLGPQVIDRLANRVLGIGELPPTMPKGGPPHAP